MGTLVPFIKSLDIKTQTISHKEVEIYSIIQEILQRPH